jgi:tRNA pseudouridine synthase 10
MILETIQSLLKEFTLCPNCLGRQFGTLLSGTSNRLRGEALLLTLGMNIHQSYIEHKTVINGIENLLKIDYEPLNSLVQKIEELKTLNILKENCYICNNLFADLEPIANTIHAHSQRYEFTTFLVGCNTPPSITEKEEFLRSKFSLQFGETLKSEFNREMGKLVLMKLENKQVEFNKPEILFVVDLYSKAVTVNSNPLFIEGSYRKLVRGIPQAIWLCNECQNKGCSKCNYTGRNYPDSVEEYITPYIQQAAKGSDVKIHCSGREDVDALMLGTGRPFVVEVREPKIRTLNLVNLEILINTSANRRLDVTLKGTSSRLVLRSLKGESTKMAKRYRMRIQLSESCPENWNENKIKKGLVGEIDQDTPNRVKHRRADLLRKRHVYDVSFIPLSDLEGEIEIYCEGGLYVKELMHGDEGRTKPSLSEILSRSVKVLYLDVLEVEHTYLES